MTSQSGVGGGERRPLVPPDCSPFVCRPTTTAAMRPTPLRETLKGRELEGRDMTEIFVDGDACPVKREVLRVAERHHLTVNMVSNSGLRSGGNPYVRNVMVAEGPDAADDWIADHIGQGDIAVTADIPLAGRCLDKGATVLGPDGKAFTADNIGAALAGREFNRHLRETGESRGFNAAFTDRDRSRFLNALDQAIRALLT